MPADHRPAAPRKSRRGTRSVRGCSGFIAPQLVRESWAWIDPHVGSVHRGVFLTHLVELDIDEQAEPERLHEMEDRTWLSVEEAEANEIAIEKIEKRTDVERHPPPGVSSCKGALIGIAEKRRLDGRIRQDPPQVLFPRLERGIPRMLLDPERDVVLF